MTQRLSPRQIILVIVVVLAFVALSIFAIAAGMYQPATPSVSGNAVALAPARLAQSIASTRPVARAGQVVTIGGDAPAGTQPVPLPPPGATTPPPADNPPALAACELGLAVPTRQAGLANLTPLVPLFGPFSPEAFAMVPAFAPGFPLVGPLITSGGDFLNDNPELTAAAYDALHPLETSGYATLAPLYEPVRPQVLAGEAQLASALAPQVSTFASLPGATCLPAALALVLS
jgi:hypothetical protein